MSALPRLVRQTLTIARRDFVATVFTPTFLLFLLAPLIMVSFGAIGGIGAANVADSADDKLRLVAIVPAELARDVAAMDRQLRTVIHDPAEPPELVVLEPEGDPAAQARALFRGGATETAAALYGPLARPAILTAHGRQGDADYLALLADNALRFHATGDRALVNPRVEPVSRPAAASPSARNQMGFFAVFGIFFLTLLLAGQAVGTMAEERANKVIEILAASAPLEAVFLGKLVGMFGVAVLFVTFWGSVLGLAASVAPPQIGAFAGAAPAVGWPVFVALFLIYFALSYLLLGATFLGIGAQAATPREIQMLSLPITVMQVGMFALASAAASRPGSALARTAEIVPLSSPLAMAARAASRPELWPHALAIVWAGLWVAAVIAVGARAFRRGVLQSGSGRPRRLGRRVRQGA